MKAFIRKFYSTYGLRFGIRYIYVNGWLYETFGNSNSGLYGTRYNHVYDERLHQIQEHPLNDDFHSPNAYTSIKIWRF